MERTMERVFEECVDLREADHKEYAHDESVMFFPLRSGNAFANFERVAEDLDLAREQVLFVYFKKHIDGIASWITGRRSHREDVRGRINDAIVYLCLLRGMVDDGVEGVAQALAE